jgi:hypothetical protein
MKPVLCIVSVYRPDVLEQARRAFAEVDSVRVIVDRRVGERRNPERASSEESRQNDRRTRRVEDRLRTSGYTIVPVGA